MPQIDLKVVGGPFTPKTPGLITVDSEGTVPSIAEEIGNLVKKPPAIVGKSKIFPIINGKKQELPFAPSDTFSGRGMSAGDILYYMFPKPPDSSPAKSDTSKGKAPQSNVVPKAPSPNKRSPPPENDGKTSPSPEVSKKALPPTKVPPKRPLGAKKSSTVSPSADAPDMSRTGSTLSSSSNDSDKPLQHGIENTNTSNIKRPKSSISIDSSGKEDSPMVKEKKEKKEDSPMVKEKKEKNVRSEATKSYDDIYKVIEKAINEKMDQITANTDSKSQQEFHQEVTELVGRELKVASTHLTALWESQKEQTLKTQEELEAKRLANLSQIVEKEAQLQESQVKFIEALQIRRVQEDKNDDQLGELFRANKELRDELLRRRETTDEKIEKLKDESKSSILMNPDTRVDNILLIQNQIGRCLKSFTSLPTQYFPGGSGDMGDLISLGLLLSHLGLEKYEQTLRDHDVTAAELLRMDEWDLKDVGIDTIGARKRILAEIERRRLANNEIYTGGKFACGNSSSNHIGNYQPLTEIYTIILQHFFRKHDPTLCDRINEMIRIFGERMEDYCVAMMYKYRVRTSPYRSLLVKYLSHKFPDILPAVDLITEGFDGREAEFGEMLEEVRLGLPLEQLNICWVEVAPTKSYPQVYYHNTMCGLSQTKAPKVLEDTTTKPIKKPTYSVPYPSKDQYFSNLNKTGSEVKNSPLQYIVNPSIEDDTRSYDRYYIAVIAAHLFEYNVGAMREFSALVKEHAGRELDWLISLRDLL